MIIIILSFFVDENTTTYNIFFCSGTYLVGFPREISSTPYVKPNTSKVPIYRSIAWIYHAIAVVIPKCNVKHILATLSGIGPIVGTLIPNKSYSHNFNSFKKVYIFNQKATCFDGSDGILQKLIF